MRGIPGWYLMAFGTLVAVAWVITVIARSTGSNLEVGAIDWIMGLVTAGLFTGGAIVRNGADKRRRGREERFREAQLRYQEQQERYRHQQQGGGEES